ncbi:MAG: hypothetical protein H6Q89_4649 [Myxococcaceae bacterium]|nr:hypothetical protein [Myxococcaceae bacterium]
MSEWSCLVNSSAQPLPAAVTAPIAVYCRSGARSAAAARLLRLGGFKVEDCSTLAQANARLARLASAG